MTNSATTTYSVPEISCGHCKGTIEAAVQGLGGVVTVDGGDRATIVTAIEDAGYDVAP
jgi:copper chaperone